MCEINNMGADQVVSTYIKMRDAKKALEAEQKLALKPYEEGLAKLEARALAILSEQGADSLKTKFGTCYSTTRRSVRASDKEAFMDYVKSHDAFDLLDIRPNKTAVEDFVGEHGDLPPGVSSETMLAVNFRRA